MTISQMYLALAIIVLAVIALLVFVVGRKGTGQRLTPLASFAFALAGLLFGENRLVGYGLMGIGVLLAVVDIFNKSRRIN
ncbi:MAG TPA: hypothetical protein VK206_01975 [Anaerolineales bacterium]|nr:hypothetical protein [Anaerolineales bacterium]